VGLREIKAALRRLENEGGDKAAKALILAVPYKRGAAPEERAEMIREIAQNRGESITEVTKMVKGWVPGVLIRAESYDSHPAEADLAMIQPGSSYEHAGDNIVYPRPDDLRWNEAHIIDYNGELFPLDRWEEAVSGILYGSRGRDRMYFEAYDARPRY
jgi:hypothetical protein